MVKGIPIIDHEGPWGRAMWMQGCTYVIYTATALGKVRVASPTLSRLYSRYSFYSRLSGPQKQSGHEGEKKISTPPTPGTEPGAHSPTFLSLHLRHNSFSNPSVSLPTSQLILQPFRCFTYVTVHSPTLLSLLIRHKLFT